MSANFENIVIEIFEDLSISKLKVNLESHHIFVCGGEVDITAQFPLSFRHYLLSYSASTYPNVYDSIVQAETFKDYFKENAYPDLLVFEEEIANLASIVLIFLESPGSLVELGMFCTKPDFFNKLLIVVPQEEVRGEDSFIYLGPLENIKKKEPTSVAVYPWPKKGREYEVENLEDLCDSIEGKLSNLPKKVRFNSENSGHIAFLIAEIIRICYPILLNEIEFALLAFKLDIKPAEITRHIYLLTKLKIVDSHFYGSHRYYYPSPLTTRIVSFGKLSTGVGFDEPKSRMKILQSYVLKKDEQSKKRRNALKQIEDILRGGGE